jgi:hypothetical protein
MRERKRVNACKRLAVGSRVNEWHYDRATINDFEVCRKSDKPYVEFLGVDDPIQSISQVSDCLFSGACAPVPAWLLECELLSSRQDFHCSACIQGEGADYINERRLSGFKDQVMTARKLSAGKRPKVDGSFGCFVSGVSGDALHF